MREIKIPFNRPFIVGKELDYIREAVSEERWLSGDGAFTEKCHQWLQSKLNCTKALLTHSCTAALEMSAILADIHDGDEVIMPSFTFVSTANAFVLRGAVPVFIDIRPDTLNMDEAAIKAAITSKTKAIVPVHYAGVSCEMDVVMDIAKQNDLLVIEDAAQALLSEYNGRALGSIGDMGTLSFHETKNIISGEGGALLINDGSLVERAEIIWEKGTDRKKFFRGEVDKYSWVDIGSSFLPSEMTAAFLYAQFEHAEEIISVRKKAFERYADGLKPLEERGLLSLPRVGVNHSANGHIFYLITRNADDQRALIKHLNDNGVNALFHYQPLHNSVAGRKYGRCSGSLNATEEYASRIVRLPLFYELSQEDLKSVIDLVTVFYNNR